MKTEDKWIRDQLVEHGKQLFNAPKQFVKFTKNDAADRLLNDLEHNPHAFVLACIMDRQIKAERAWFIPYRFLEKLDEDFSIGKLNMLSVDDVKQLMTNPEPLHRFAAKMAVFFHAAIHRIVEQYEGDASLIWKGRPSSANVVYRFLEFAGVGPKIANMAANILARDFKIPLADYYSIDISADVHVRRVFERLGLTFKNPTVDQCIFQARALYPKFPGLMDLPVWEIGRNWCRPKNPQCQACYMRVGCNTIRT